MPKTKRLETTALFGLLLQLVFLCIAYWLYSTSGSRAVLAQTWFFAPGVLLWLVVLLHGRQQRLARQEREELEELQRTRLSEEIFEEQELDRMRAHTGLVIFERFLVPAISIILAGVLLFLAYRCIWSAWTARALLTIKEPLVPAVAFAVFIAFPGFLMGKYACGLARSSELRLLRAAGSYLLGNVVASLLLAVAMAMIYFEIAWMETAVSYVIPGLMGLIGAEIILNLILDIYRPRVPGREARPPYDSRLLGLIAEPGSVLKTLAATLDYQFGFKLSETWFYRFMARAIVPLILIQVLALWLLSCLAFVAPHQAAFIERFGRPRLTVADKTRGLQASLYEPGFHLKWPWPFEVTRLVPARRIDRLELGKVRFAEDELRLAPPKGVSTMNDPDIILWKEWHIDPADGYEVDLLVPSFAEVETAETDAPAINIARFEAYVHYRIKRAESGEVDEAAAYDFYYRHADAPRLLENLAYAVVCRLAARQNFLRWINVEREEVSNRFRDMLQQELDEHRTGLELVYAGIPSVHPPAETAADYEDVIAAGQEKEGMLHKAKGRKAAILGRAEGEKETILGAARSYKYGLTTLAELKAKRFLAQLEAYRKAPLAYLHRKRLSAIEEVLKDQRVYIVPVSEEEVLFIDLQEKLRSDILDIDTEEAVR